MTYPPKPMTLHRTERDTSYASNLMKACSVGLRRPANSAPALLRGSDIRCRDTTCLRDGLVGDQLFLHAAQEDVHGAVSDELAGDGLNLPRPRGGEKKSVWRCAGMLRTILVICEAATPLVN